MCLLKAVDTLGPYKIEGAAKNDHGNVCNGSQTYVCYEVKTQK
jgi:hypothetical protein